jgi:hypothetical protein
MMIRRSEADFVVAVDNIRILREAANRITDSATVDSYNQDVFTLLQQAFEAAWAHEAAYMMSKYPELDKSHIYTFVHNANSSRQSPNLFDGQSCSSEQ